MMATWKSVYSELVKPLWRTEVGIAVPLFVPVMQKEVYIILHNIYI